MYKSHIWVYCCDVHIHLATLSYFIFLCQTSIHLSAVSPTSLIYPKQEMQLGVRNTLICFVNDFHPPLVGITWTKNGEQVDESEVNQTQYYSNGDFSFRISSYLDFTPRESDIYSCSVDHVSLQMPLTQFWGRSVVM